MKGFAKTITVDNPRVRVVVHPTVAKVRTTDYREVGHIMPAQEGGFRCMRCGKIVAHCDDPRAAVEALVREYNRDRRRRPPGSGGTTRACLRR